LKYVNELSDYASQVPNVRSQAGISFARMSLDGRSLTPAHHFTVA
jgi:hypothetical protein